MKIKIIKRNLSHILNETLNRNYPMYDKNMHNIDRLDKYLSENGLYDNFFVMAHMTGGTKKSEIKRSWFQRGLSISGGFVTTAVHVTNSLREYVEKFFYGDFIGKHHKAGQVCILLVSRKAIKNHGYAMMNRDTDSYWLDMSMESEANNPQYDVAPGCMTFAYVDFMEGYSYINNACLSWAGQVLSGDDIAINDPWLWNEQNNS